MKRLKLTKIIATTLVYVTTFLAYPTSVLAVTTGWINQGPYWSYNDSDGSQHKGWLKDGDKWYYFADGGWMEKGTKIIDGKTYFFSESGELLKEIPTEDGVINSIYDKDGDGIVTETRITDKYDYKNGKAYLLDGYANEYKYFNDDGTVATNTLIEPIGKDGSENHWIITDKYGYRAQDMTKLNLNGMVYMQIDDGWGTESDLTTIDPDTGKEIYITVDESLGKNRHPMCIAKNQWWYGYGGTNYGWHYIDSNNKFEKNVWKQSKDKTKWYYLGDDGRMVACKWIKSGDSWYYLGPNGDMLTNTTIDGYKLGADGRCL